MTPTLSARIRALWAAGASVDIMRSSEAKDDIIDLVPEILAALEREEARADVSVLAKRVTDDVLSHPTIRKIDLDAPEWSGAVSVFDIIHVALKTVAAPPTPDRALVEALLEEVEAWRARENVEARYEPSVVNGIPDSVSLRQVNPAYDAACDRVSAARLATDAEKLKERAT